MAITIVGVGPVVGSRFAQQQFQGNAVQNIAALKAVIPSDRFDKQERFSEGPPLDEYVFDLQSSAASNEPDVLVPDDSPATGRWLRHMPTGGVPAAHDLGGSEHTADTLANLNTKVSDATLVDGATKLSVDGSIEATGNINPSAGGGKSLGVNGREWDSIHVQSILRSTNVQLINLGVAGSAIVFNEGGLNIDLRVEGDTDPDLFSTDAGLERVGVGVALNAHLAKFQVNGGILGQYDVEANTDVSASPNALVAAESRRLLTNEGIAAQNFHTLPTAAAGLEFKFIVQDADGIRIVANTGDTIRIGPLVSIAAGFVESTTIGDEVTLIAINATEWLAEITGTWSVETS